MAKKVLNTKAATAITPQSSNQIKPLGTEDFPRRTLDQCIRVPKALHEIHAGQGTGWGHLAKSLEIGEQSPNTKYLFWSAESYGITSREGDTISLTETGRKLVAPTYEGEDTEAKRKALLTPAILSKFYTDYNGHPIPGEEHLRNVLETKYHIPRNRLDESVKIILENAQFGGILKETEDGKKSISLGPDRGSPTAATAGTTNAPVVDIGIADQKTLESEANAGRDWAKTCFYITPIGEDGTEVRKHADMMLKHLLEPVLKPLGFEVIRADKIDRSGLITQQIFEHLAMSRLCVADLSFSNPNAFYELGVRHVTLKSTVQLIRKGDRIPFDVAQGRTIIVDTSDVYTVTDRLESARRELAEHIKHATGGEPDDSAEGNPVSLYLPSLKVTLK